MRSGISGRCWRETGRILPRRGHSWDVWVGYLAAFGRRYGCIFWAKGVDEDVGQRKELGTQKRYTKEMVLQDLGKGIPKSMHT